MGGLFWALVAFIGTHFLLSHPLRPPLVKALGEKAFSAVYSLVAFGTFYLVFAAFKASPRGEMHLARSDAADAPRQYFACRVVRRQSRASLSQGGQ
jgi:uncharacterized membrane protein